MSPSSTHEGFSTIPLLYVCLFMFTLSLGLSIVRLFISRQRNALPMLDVPRALLGLEVAILIICWYGVSILLTMLMKWFLQHWYGTGFPFPITTAAIHMILKFSLSRLLVRCQRLQLKRYPTAMFWKCAVPIGIFTSLDIMCSTLSFVYVTVTFYTIVKSGSNVWNLIFSVLLKLQPAAWSLFLVIVLICSGIGLASYGSVDFVWTGFWLVLAASILGTLRWVLTQYLLKQIGSETKSNRSITLIYEISPASAISLIPAVIFMEAKKVYNSDIFEDADAVTSAAAFIMLGGVLAFMLILIEISLVKKTSSLSLGIAGNLKDVTQITLSVFIFGDHLSPINIVGLVLAFIGMLLYTFLKNRHALKQYFLVNETVNDKTLEEKTEREENDTLIEEELDIKLESTVIRNTV